MIRSSFKAKPRTERAEKAWPGVQTFAQATRCDSMPAAAQPKEVARRCPALLELARGKPCLLRISGVCCGGTETTVAAHSNYSVHGKGGHRKADDCYSVWACARCHTWLDSSYVAEYEEKVSAFMLAHLEQVNEWRQIAAGPASREQRAAEWALIELNAIPVSLASVSDAAVKGHA